MLDTPTLECMSKGWALTGSHPFCSVPQQSLPSEALCLVMASFHWMAPPSTLMSIVRPMYYAASSSHLTLMMATAVYAKNLRHLQ